VGVQVVRPYSWNAVSARGTGRALAHRVVTKDRRFRQAPPPGHGADLGTVAGPGATGRPADSRDAARKHPYLRETGRLQPPNGVDLHFDRQLLGPRRIGQPRPMRSADRDGNASSSHDFMKAHGLFEKAHGASLSDAMKARRLGRTMKSLCKFPGGAARAAVLSCHAVRPAC
jgi:hypothetical protein